MVQQSQADWNASIVSMFNNGGNATANEFRTVMANLMDSVAFVPVMGGLPNSVLKLAEVNGLPTFQASAITDTDTMVQVSKTVMGPGAGVVRAGHFDLSSAGSAMSVVDAIDGTSQGLVTHPKAVGSKPYYNRPTASGVMMNTGADGSETFTGTTLQFNFANLSEGEAVSYTASRAAGAAEITDCNIQIRRTSHATNPPLFDYKRDISGGVGFTLLGGAGITSTIITFPVQPFFAANEMLYFTVTGDDSTPLNFRGQTIGGQMIPVVDVVGDLTSRTDIVDREDYTQADQDKLRGLPSAIPAMGKSFRVVTERRSDEDLSFSTASAVGPGALVLFNDTSSNLDCQVPASTTDDQIGYEWGVQNSTFGALVTLTAETVANHSFVLQGYSLPFEIPAGVGVRLMVIGRTVNGGNTTTSLRLSQWDSGIEGTEQILSSAGNTLSVAGRAGGVNSIRHAAIDADGTGTFTGLGSLPTNEQQEIVIANTHASRPISMGIASDRVFDLMTTGRVVIPPQRLQRFYLANVAGQIEVGVLERPSYSFRLEPSDVVRNDGLVMPSPPDDLGQLVQAGTGDDDDSLIIQPNVAGHLSVQFEGLADYKGAQEFPTVALVTVGIRVNGASVAGFSDLTIAVRRSLPAEPFRQMVRNWLRVPVSAGDNVSFHFDGLNADSNFDLDMIEINTTWTLEL